MSNPFQVMIVMYLGTVAINIIISLIQYRADRHSSHRNILFYWLSTIVAFFVNGWLPENDMRIVVVVTLGGFLSNKFLATFFSEMHGVKISWRRMFLVCCAFLGLSFVLSIAGYSFTVYAFPGIFGCTLPMFVALYTTVKNKKYPLTTVQKIFIGTCVAFSFHVLDWSYFRTRPDIMLVGAWIAFIMLYTLSIIAPFMGNENLLQRRNEQLSDEVKKQASQLAAAEFELWEVNKLASLGRMAGGIAHEINNPMQIIVLQANEFVYHSKNGPVSSEMISKGANRIVQMVDRISKITDSLRKVARDRRTAEKEKNDLVQIVNDTLDLCLNRMTELEIEFSSEIPRPPLEINCNAVEISQVLLNLLNNSIDAVENLPDKRIKLNLQKMNSMYRMTIDDSGTIDSKLVPRLMEPFFTTKPVGKGTGLGLSISKSIVEDHQGNLYLDTSHQTTRFILELPI